MRKWIPLLFVLLLGCAAPRQPEIGNVRIHVPKEFPISIGWVDKTPTHYERYLEMFRNGYWDCVLKYYENINYVLQKPDTYANGWMSEIAGYADGYYAAEKEMQRNLKLFGKERTAAYLKRILNES